MKLGVSIRSVPLRIVKLKLVADVKSRVHASLRNIIEHIAISTFYVMRHVVQEIQLALQRAISRMSFKAFRDRTLPSDFLHLDLTFLFCQFFP